VAWFLLLSPAHTLQEIPAMSSALAELAFLEQSQSNVAPYLTPREVAARIDAVIHTLRTIAYYCAVENKAARTTGVTSARQQLRILANAIEEDGTSPVPGNLKKLLTFMVYSLEGVNRTNNAEAAQECVAMLEPLKAVFTALGD
jgi:flagellin-specific chaperone FliS